MIARLLISPSSELIKQEIDLILASHLKGGNSNFQSHPDLLYFPKDSKLGISEARKIKEHFSLKPYSAKGRVVALEDATALTIEAQNALLKALEELPDTAILILAASSDANFLPTVLSRCKVVRLQGKEEGMQGYEKDIDKLLKSSIEDRFIFIEKLKEREEFLHCLTSYFQQNLRLHLKELNLNFLKELSQAEKWAKQNVNLRAILEYLMLVMPKQN